MNHFRWLKTQKEERCPRMTQDPLEQLKRLSQTIREEEISLLAEGLTDDSKEFLSSQEIRRQREKETYALLLLRSLRIHLCLELLEQGVFRLPFPF